MLKDPSPQQYQFETITLDELVPEDHLVRKIDATIDFEFIRDAVAHLYCPDNGRPAIDPVRLIKMMLLGYLFGTRIHTPVLFTKEIDSSSPYLYKAVTIGQILKSAEFKWYRINDAGQEVEYFNTKLENVKLVKVAPEMYDIKDLSK